MPLTRPGPLLGAQCIHDEGTWSFRDVYCEPLKTIRGLDRERNTVVDNSPGVGGWGGMCTCPDGQEYLAGDMNNACGSLVRRADALELEGPIPPAKPTHPTRARSPP